MKLKLIFLTLLFSGSSAMMYSQTSTVKQVKLTDFELQSSALINSTGEQISKPDYHSKVYWFPV
ncbi:MAG TPA: hypothetical protein VJ963_03365, partial [Bacteroidales bacterium]|nr:hypothetical protein [Bacteroidales bacterium]